MTFIDFLKCSGNATLNGMYGKFATKEDTTCSPDPCRAEWCLSADDVTQLVNAFGVTRLFEAIDTCYNETVVNEICSAVRIHSYVKWFSETKVTLTGDHGTFEKDLYALKKQIEEDGFIVYALNNVMWTVLDSEKIDFCVVAIMFMDLLRRKED